MLKALIKKQFLEMFRFYFSDKKTGKRKSTRSTVMMFVLFAFLIAFLGVSIYMIAGQLADGTLNLGFNWLYFAFMGLISVVLGVFGSVFNTYASLYLSKDNQQLLAMPIPPLKLLLSRLIAVFAMSLLYSGIVWVPAAIAFWVRVPATPMNVIDPVLLLFVISFLVSALTCVLGWLVALISRKAKGKSYITVVLSLAFIAGYYYVYGNLMQMLTDLTAHLDELQSALKTWTYPMYLMGRAADGEWLAMIEFSLLCVAAFAVCVLVMSANYVKIITTSDKTKKKAVNTSVSRQSVPFRALLRKEFKRFTSSATYMLNCGLGIILLPALAVFLAIKSPVLLPLMEAIPEIKALLPAMMPAILGMLCFTILISAPSVSLEGKSLWILQSLPVDPARVLLAKQCLHMIPAGASTLISALILCISMKVPAPETALILLCVLLLDLLCASLGLVLDLKKANLTWTNEVVPVKQGAPVAICLFGGWVFSIAIGAAAYFTRNLFPAYLFLLILIAVLALICWLVERWFKTRGATIFSEL